MRGYNYHFALNDTGNIATLRPTFGTYVKAYMPSLVISLATWVWMQSSVKKAEAEMEALNNEFDLQ